MSHLQNRKSRRGFTLVELVVVILVMGIIAAVAGPKMFNTAKDARVSGTKTSLSVVRDAIELYKAQTGAYPAGPTEADVKTQLASYIRGKFPKAEIGAAADTVRVVSAGTPLTVSGTEAWAYDTQSGEFIVNSTTESANTW